MVRGIDAKDSADLRAKWGDKPCEHPGVLREYVRGCATGDYICVRCGEAGWGEGWVEKEKPEEKWMANQVMDADLGAAFERTSSTD